MLPRLSIAIALVTILTPSTPAASPPLPAPASFTIHATRPTPDPIIPEQFLPGEAGVSINGPSLIRVPSWVKNPLGKYYLYFAHHAGLYIRLAYADNLAGPWKMYDGHVMPLGDQKAVIGHIASPDVIVDDASHQICLFYHGGHPPGVLRPTDIDDAGSGGLQLSSVATSADGLNFTPSNAIIGPGYLRVFPYRDHWYGLSDSGWLRRCDRLGAPFTPVAKVIGDDIAASLDPVTRHEPGATERVRTGTGPDRYALRHVAVDVLSDRLVVYFSCVGHRPERILATVIPLTGPPEKWHATGTWEVLRPETEAEGARLPLAYSSGGISKTHVNELRDPGIFREGNQSWLLYSLAGEHGLGLAKLTYGGL